MRRLLAILALVTPALMPRPAHAGASLLDAAAANDRASAFQALQEGADARARRSDGTTALHYAAHFGDVDLA